MKASAEIALLYNFNDPERARKVKSVLLCMKARAKVVPEEAFSQPVGTLAGLLDAAAASPEDTGDFTEEMLVIHRFSSQRIDELLTRLRKAGVGNIPYKAVLTDTNASWSGVKLYQELQQEHAAMQQGTTAHQPQA